MDKNKFIDDPKENRKKLKRWLHEENKKKGTFKSLPLTFSQGRRSEDEALKRGLLEVPQKVKTQFKTLTEPTLHVQFKPVCKPA